MLLLLLRREMETNSVYSWGIRNSGLLLLRSLEDVLLGTGDSKVSWDGKSIRLAYDQYPSLPGILIRLLSGGTANRNLGKDTAAVEAVFPALDIIRRAGPPKSHFEEVSSLVSAHLSNSSWHIRDLAATTTAALYARKSWVVSIVELLQTPYSTMNDRHGLLLAVNRVLGGQLELDSETSYGKYHL